MPSETIRFVPTVYRVLDADDADSPRLSHYIHICSEIGPINSVLRGLAFDDTIVPALRSLESREEGEKAAVESTAGLQNGDAVALN